jgi:AraC-like DNA-binding protein
LPVRNETNNFGTPLNKDIDMNNLPRIEMHELTESITISENYHDSIIIAAISYPPDSGYYNSEPVRLNVPVIVIVLRGSAQINLDYVSYTVSANYLVTVMPTHIVQLTEMSHDFKAKLLIVDKTLLENCKFLKRTPSMLSYMEFRKNPCTLLCPEETAHIERCLAQLGQKVKLRTHAFHQEVMQNAMIAFLLELANILIGKKETVPAPAFTRKEELMNRFIQLLSEHVAEQRLVTFYAGKLSITPQYLTLILKKLTGKTANEWIDETLVVEAKMLLRSPHASIQQIADALNFSDQSTFGKFFKKRTGISPTAYRKSQPFLV